MLFAGGRYLRLVPAARPGLRRLGVSCPGRRQIPDYFWHITLPVIALVIGGFARLTMLTKNSFLDEINKQYVVTARAKGLTRAPGAVRPRVPQRHADRRSPASPALFIGILFTGALLIEVIFSLDGLGLLGFEAAINRDYPVDVRARSTSSRCWACCMNIVSDLIYVLVDPRIDFERARGRERGGR